MTRTDYINRRPDTIYVAKPVGFDGPFKIGSTSDLKRRLRHLDNGSPFPIELVCSMPGDIVLERRIHARLRSAHVRCEWFEDCPEVRAVVAEIKAQSLEADALPAPIGIANMKAENTGRAWSAAA